MTIVVGELFKKKWMHMRLSSVNGILPTSNCPFGIGFVISLAVEAVLLKSKTTPQIQQLPAKSSIARQIRKAYLESDQAPKLVAMDFRDLEIRVMAMKAEREV